MTRKEKKNREIRLKKWLKLKELTKEKLHSLLGLSIKIKIKENWKKRKISGHIEMIGNSMIGISGMCFRQNEIETAQLIWKED